MEWSGIVSVDSINPSSVAQINITVADYSAIILVHAIDDVSIFGDSQRSESLRVSKSVLAISNKIVIA
jgi:hypothetical protein